MIAKIHLFNFRNFFDFDLEFDDRITVIIGPNGVGKTNLLEGVYYLLTGRSFRTNDDRDITHWDNPQTVMHLHYRHHQTSQIVFTPEGKKFYINKNYHNHANYIKMQLKPVIFTPEHLRLLIDGPSVRRDYLDSVINLSDPLYYQARRNYEVALHKRNKILEHFSKSASLGEQLNFWDDYLTKQSQIIISKRQDYLDFANRESNLADKLFKLIYEPNPFTQERALAVRKQEQQQRRTLIGPQRDNFTLNIKFNEQWRSLQLYGSRGQQRLGVFWLKQRELAWQQTHSLFKPILLLDDILSEFDNNNRQLITQFVGQYQTILTATDANLYKNKPGKLLKLG